MYANAVSHSKFYRSEKEHLTWKIDGFNGLATLFERLHKSRGVVLTDILILKFRFGRERHVTFLHLAHTETAKQNNKKGVRFLHYEKGDMRKN